MEKQRKKQYRLTQIEKRILRDDNNRKSGINWWGVSAIIIWAMIMGFLGIGFAETINKINGLPELSLYGIWASYTIISILFWIITKDWKITK